MGIKHIPYRGAAEMTESLLRGDTQIMIISRNSVQSHVTAGKIRWLAVGIPTRLKQLPDVPTVSEVTGLKDFSFPGQQALFMKAGTPRPVIERLSGALRKALANQAVAERVFTTTGIELMPTTPEQFADLIRADIAKYTRAVKISGARP